MQFPEKSITFPDTILLYQQVVEKSLKALYFAYSSDGNNMDTSSIFHSHDCKWIVQQMQSNLNYTMEYDDLDFLLSAATQFDNLGRQAFDARSLCVRARYMQNVSDDKIPSDIFTSDDALHAMDLAHRIVDFCDKMICWD